MNLQADQLAYVPTTPSDWAGSVPAWADDAFDVLAARMALAKGDTGPQGPQGDPGADGDATAFTAGDATKWADPPPTTIAEALDRIAAVLGATDPIP
jgi:hypothetical protein